MVYLKLTKEYRLKTRWIPNGATVYREDGTTVVYTYPLADKIIALGYRGNAGKAAFHVSFKTEDALKKYVDNFFDGLNEHKAHVQKIRDEKKTFVTGIKPGDILYTHWGYDQTNRDFYLVLSVKKNEITFQEIQQHVVETGFMCGKTTPIPGAIRQVPTWDENNKHNGYEDAPILKRRVQAGGEYAPDGYVKVDDVRTAWKWKGEPLYVSWYA